MRLLDERGGGRDERGRCQTGMLCIEIGKTRKVVDEIVWYNMDSFAVHCTGLNNGVEERYSCTKSEVQLIQ